MSYETMLFRKRSEKARKIYYTNTISMISEEKTRQIELLKRKKTGEKV